MHDLFLPNDFREELQKKAAATLQTLPSMSIERENDLAVRLTFLDTQLPAQVDYFHSLVPLDLSHQKNAATFGYPSWVYKAQSSKDGNFYALRRLEGMPLEYSFVLAQANQYRFPLDQRKGDPLRPSLETRV